MLESRKHFENALELLAAHPLDAPLPEAENLTARRLHELIASMLTTEVTA
jgi:hypothetical protein